MSASPKQAPCSTALAIYANSISALARQAFSRLAERGEVVSHRNLTPL
jgi:hypothetical protein